jgi:diaminohydroxyphosphoribosylaminopyrimidine deaminase/5-amino-6-(5-phosphoribosylamino)uracil reductase
VAVGVGHAEAGESLAPYLHHRRTGRPYVVLKAAISMDGRTAARDGSARWITGPEARADSHALRARSQAIVVGAGTALADRPALTVRDVPLPSVRQPLRVLLDARGRVPATGPLFDVSAAPTLVITTDRADPITVADWQRSGADVAVVPGAEDGPGVDLEAAFQTLARQGVLQAMVEGGATVHGACVRAGLAQRLVLYVGACTLGEHGRPLLAGPGPGTMNDAGQWCLRDVRQLGGDVRLDYRPAGREEH